MINQPNRTPVFLIMLVLMGFCISSWASPKSVRVAVVALSNHDTIQSVSDLSEVQLADESGLVVVERREVERLLSEQKFSRGLLSDPERALQLGGMLKTDLMILLDFVPGLTNAVNAAIFETTHGRRLWDEILTSNEIDQQVERVVACVHKALQKRESERGVTVCVLGVRNADLPRDKNAMGDILMRLVERRLAGLPDVMLLERSHLDLWRREQELACTTEVLRASASLIEFEMSRGDQENEVRCTAYLSDHTGTIHHKPTVSGTLDVADLSDRLWEEMCRVLCITGLVTTVDRHVEALQFSQEAKRLQAHEEWDKALRSATAAFALNPDHAAIRSDLTMLLVQCAKERIRRDPEAAINLASQSLGLYDRRGYSKHNKYPAKREMIQFLKGNKNTFLDDSKTRDAFIDLQHQYLISHDIGEGSSTNISDWSSPEIAACSVTSSDYTRHVGAQVRKWMRQCDQSDYEWKYCNQRMFALWLKMCTKYWPETTSPFERDDVFYRGVNALCIAMTQAQDPLIQFLGQLGVLIHDADTEEMDDQKIMQRWWQLYDQVKPYTEELKLGEQTKYRQRRRAEAYWILLEGADLVQDAGRRFSLIQQVFDLSMSNHDISYIVNNVATTDKVSDWRNIARYDTRGQRFLPACLHTQVMENIECVLAAMDDPAFDHPDPWGWRRDKNWLKYRWADYQSRWFPASATQGMRCLLEKEEYAPKGKFAAMEVEGNTIYIALTLPERGRTHPVTRMSGSFGIKILGLNKGSGESKSLGVLPVFDCNDMAPSDSGIYVATEDGLWFCAVNDDPQRFGEGCLPSQIINSVAHVGDDLFLGLGSKEKGMHFVRFNPWSRKITVIASSERRDPKTPFDNIHPGAFVRKIYPDMERNRLVLVVDRSRDINNKDDYLPLIGLWQYDLEQNELQQMVSCHRSMWAGSQSNGKFLFSPWSTNPWQPGRRYRPWYGVVEFDMATDSCDVLFSHRGLPAGHELVANETTITSDTDPEPPFLLQSGLLFMEADGVLQWSRLSDETLHPFFQWVPIALAPMNAQSILVLTEKQLWSVDLQIVGKDQE